MEERTTSPARMPRKLAMVITATSRWATWDSSWDSTASSSGGDSRRWIPVVTQTTACCWLRPVAKALGRSVSAMATLGLGMSARAQSRSTIWCSPGARPARPGETVRKEGPDEQERAGDHDDQHPALQDRDEDGDKDHVQQAEQEHRAEHAARETGVGRDRRSCHQIVTPG